MIAQCAPGGAREPENARQVHLWPTSFLQLHLLLEKKNLVAMDLKEDASTPLLGWLFVLAFPDAGICFYGFFLTCSSLLMSVVGVSLEGTWAVLELQTSV